MALKPGQAKEIKLKLTKIENLKKLEKKLEDMRYSQFPSGSVFSKKLQAQIKAVNVQIKKEMLELKETIKKAKAESGGAITVDNQKVIQTIATECSEYIALFKQTKKVLFRGVGGNIADKKVFHGRSWEDRKPKDSKAVVQAIYDKLSQDMGIKALRKNSIFTTASYGFASDYGASVYIIIPKNGATFTYSKKLADIVLRSVTKMIDTKKFDAFLASFKQHLKDKNVTGYKFEDAWYYFKNFALTGEEAKAKAILKKHKFPNASKFSIMNFISPEEFQKTYDLSSENLPWALSRSNEILISGEYYAISTRKRDFATAMLEALGINATNYKANY